MDDSFAGCERPKGEEGRVQRTGYLDTSAPKRRCWPQSKVKALDKLSRAAEIAKTSETARSATGKTASHPWSWCVLGKLRRLQKAGLDWYKEHQEQRTLNETPPKEPRT